MDPIFIVILVSLSLAIVTGLFANRWVRPFATSEVQGVKLEALVGPLVSITVLLLAFTLVTIFGSFQRAQFGASEEARKVDHQFEMAQLASEPQRQRLMSAMTCYALAVSTYEWESMAEASTAAEVSPWTASIRAGIGELVATDTVPTPVLSAILTADRDRGEARSKRLAEAVPAIPTPLKFLLVVTASAGLFALATFTLPNVRRRVQVGVLITLGGVFTLFLIVMADMDRPYDGAIALPPRDITRVAGDLLEDYTEEYPATPLPCDDTGRSQQAES
jgi:L-lactate permease